LLQAFTARWWDMDVSIAHHLSGFCSTWRVRLGCALKEGDHDTVTGSDRRCDRCALRSSIRGDSSKN
jgi:hypothetical protein